MVCDSAGIKPEAISRCCATGRKQITSILHQPLTNSLGFVSLHSFTLILKKSTYLGFQINERQFWSDYLYGFVLLGASINSTLDLCKSAPPQYSFSPPARAAANKMSTCALNHHQPQKNQCYLFLKLTSLCLFSQSRLCHLFGQPFRRWVLHQTIPLLSFQIFICDKRILEIVLRTFSLP